MSDRFVVMRAKGSGPFGAPAMSILHERDHVAEVVAIIDNQALALRIADLLNRNGMVDVPLEMPVETEE